MNKNFSQKLKGNIFKVPYNLHRDCFQKNVISGMVVKARKLFFFELFIYVICDAQKVKLSLTLKSGQHMHTIVQCVVKKGVS